MLTLNIAYTFVSSFVVFGYFFLHCDMTRQKCKVTDCKKMNKAKMLLKEFSGIFLEIFLECLWLAGFFTHSPLVLTQQIIYPANKYMLKVNNRNTRKRCEIYQS